MGVKLGFSHTKGRTDWGCFETRVLRSISGPKMKWQDTGEDCRGKSFKICTLHQMACSTHGRWEMQTRFLSEIWRDETTQKTEAQMKR